MSTFAAHPPTLTPDSLFRLSVSQYHTMIESGALTDEDPVELLEGVLVVKMPKNPSHPVAIRLLISLIDALLPTGFHLRVQDPITLDDSEPEPDGAIARGLVRDYANHHPGPTDIPLIIEVSDTTLDRDRGIKLRCYARAGIPIYWIVNLPERQLEVYTQPQPDLAEPTYADRRIFDASQSLEFSIDGRPLGTIAVRDLLP